MSRCDGLSRVILNLINPPSELGIILSYRFQSVLKRRIQLTSRAMINEFMAQKSLALVRSSRNKRISGVNIDKELTVKGYSVAVVYLDEEGIGSKLAGLKEPVGGAIIAVPSDQTAKAVQQMVEGKIPRVWMQRGSESKSAILLCEEKGISAIHGECVMMFAEPVRSIHAFHRWILNLFGKLPN
jgi:uncharacterized protein